METLSIETNDNTRAVLQDAARPYLVVLRITPPGSRVTRAKVMGRYATRKAAGEAHRRLSAKLGFVDFRQVLA